MIGGQVDEGLDAVDADPGGLHEPRIRSPIHQRPRELLAQRLGTEDPADRAHRRFGVDATQRRERALCQQVPGTAQDVESHRIPVRACPCDLGREGRDDAHPGGVCLQIDVGLLEIWPTPADGIRERRRCASTIVVAHRGDQRFASEPKAAAGVSHEVAPAVDARGAAGADTESHDPRSRRDDGTVRGAAGAEVGGRRIMRDDGVCGPGAAHQRRDSSRSRFAVGKARNSRREVTDVEVELVRDLSRRQTDLREHRLIGANARQQSLTDRGIRAHAHLHASLAGVDRDDCRYPSAHWIPSSARNATCWFHWRAPPPS